MTKISVHGIVFVKQVYAGKVVWDANGGAFLVTEIDDNPPYKFNVMIPNGSIYSFGTHYAALIAAIDLKATEMRQKILEVDRYRTIMGKSGFDHNSPFWVGTFEDNVAGEPDVKLVFDE